MPYYSEIEWELLQEDQIFESPIWKFEFPFEVPPIKKLIIIILYFDVSLVMINR